MRFLYLLFAALLAVPARAQLRPAAAPADTTLPAVSVVATRSAQAPVLGPSRVTVLGAEAIEATGAPSVADLLEARSAASVRRYGPGGLASLSLRGAGAAQTLVLLDGHRLADPQLGQLDLALLPTVLLESVDILHGAGSALYGTDGIGGVVNLGTVRADRSRLRLRTSAGAWGERALSGLGAARRGTVSTVVAAEVRAADGDFPTFDPNAGLDGSTVRRVGADRSLASVFARVAVHPEGSRTRGQVAAWAGTAERGLPGTLGSAPQGARQEDHHLRVWGDVTTRLGAGSVRVGGLVQQAALRYQNPALALDDTGRTTLASADVEARQLVGRWLVGGGVSGGIGAAAHPSLDDARETRLSAFAHAAGEVGPLLVYPALRADVYLRGSGGEALAALSPRLGLNLPAGPLRLKASAGSAFRAPTFNDRFWQPGGNPDLRPEQGWTLDAGAALARGGTTAELTLFVSRLRDQIVWQPGDAGFYVPENLRQTRTLGLEASAERRDLRLGPATLGGGLVYTLTDARDRSPGGTFGAPLRYVSRHAAKLWADAALPVGARTTLRLDLSGRVTGARPTRADGSRRLPASAALDAHLRLTHRLKAATVSLGLAVENVLNADLEVVRGYPLPPRHARARLSLSF